MLSNRHTIMNRLRRPTDHTHLGNKNYARENHHPEPVNPGRTRAENHGRRTTPRGHHPPGLVQEGFTGPRPGRVRSGPGTLPTPPASKSTTRSHLNSSKTTRTENPRHNTAADLKPASNETDENTDAIERASRSQNSTTASRSHGTTPSPVSASRNTLPATCPNSPC